MDWVALKGRLHRGRVIASVGVGLLAVLAAGQVVRAAASATDNASDPAYSSGWSYGSNGGTGFSPWTLNTYSGGGGAGYFIYDSTTNGSGSSGGINSSGNKSFGLYSYSGGFDDAYRSFTADSTGTTTLQMNQEFTMQIDNGYIDGGAVGVGLQDSVGDNRFEFYFVSGQSDYTIKDGSGTFDTGIGYTDGGLTLSYQVTGANTYDLTVIRFPSTGQSGSTAYTFAGIDTGSTYDISQLHVFDSNGASDGNHNYYVNDLSITTVPEPGCFGILAGTGLLCLRRRRAIRK
jgi:hypothetical protein